MIPSMLSVSLLCHQWVGEVQLLIGGHDGSSYLNSVEVYDPKTDQWSCQIPATGSCRTSVGVAVLGECIYAVGGQDGSAWLSLVERYATFCCIPVVPPPACTHTGTAPVPTNGSK